LTSDPDKPVSVTIITGFLGSGKTTLLRSLLDDPAMDETAVLINEFGEIGLDHLLVRRIDDEILLLASGCICCTVQSDFVASLAGLFARRDGGEVPAFRRVVIETTGLADPAPIIHLLMTDPLLSRRCRVDGVVTTVDALNGGSQLDADFVSVKQAAMADRIALTKSDLADDAAALRTRLAALNPAAPILPCRHGDLRPDQLFAGGATADVDKWLHRDAYHDDGGGNGHGHDARISSHCMVVEDPVPWDGFSAWLESLLASRGEEILRTKGILNVAGRDRPTIIQGVQHIFHPPLEIDAWPDDDRRSHIVFISRDISGAAIEASFREAVH
jgi:G3E family GTPase